MVDKNSPARYANSHLGKYFRITVHFPILAKLNTRSYYDYLFTNSTSPPYLRNGQFLIEGFILAYMATFESRATSSDNPGGII